ncbi:MAG: cytochrome c [Alphaproteobacteria bacterium]|nr:cytochrome c [Alphaproteobacteria bacterium]
MMVALVGFSGLASGQDRAAVLKERQDTMKEQGKDLKNVKAYLDGKGELAPAKSSATNLTKTTNKIPDLFPRGTEGPNPTGDYAAKPAIWTDWNKFLDAQKTAVAKANALVVALNGGDKGAVQAAYADLGKNGCGACHTTFREKIEK